MRRRICFVSFLRLSSNTHVLCLYVSRQTHTHTRVTHIPSCASKFRHTKSHIYIYIYIYHISKNGMQPFVSYDFDFSVRNNFFAPKNRNYTKWKATRIFPCVCMYVYVCMYVCVSECMLWVHAYASSHVRGNSWRKIAGRVFVIGNINWQLQTLKRNNQLLNYSTKYFLHK